MDIEWGEIEHVKGTGTCHHDFVLLFRLIGKYADGLVEFGEDF